MSKSTKQEEETAIRVESLKKTFGSGESAVTAVEDVSFEIPSGSVVGLLGPNGAGKSTTIKCMLGLVLPEAGTVEITGIDVSENPDEAYGRVGAMLEGARNLYWRLTVQENLSFFAGLGGRHPESVRDRHETLLAEFGLADRADTTVNELSRGMKQKLSLASTLARDVEVVVMDEPTLGLDVEASLELRSQLRDLADRKDVTVLLSSHDMDVVEAVCDSVLVLDEGTIVAHEEVNELLDLFRTQQYRLTVEPPVSPAVRHRLESSVDADWNDQSDKITVTFTATGRDELYTVVDALHETPGNIRRAESIEPDMQDVFLRLTDDSYDSPGGVEPTDAGGWSDREEPFAANGTRG